MASSNGRVVFTNGQFAPNITAAPNVSSQGPSWGTRVGSSTPNVKAIDIAAEDKNLTDVLGTKYIYYYTYSTDKDGKLETVDGKKVILTTTASDLISADGTIYSRLNQSIDSLYSILNVTAHETLTPDDVKAVEGYEKNLREMIEYLQKKLFDYLSALPLTENKLSYAQVKKGGDPRYADQNGNGGVRFLTYGEFTGVRPYQLPQYQPPR